MAECPDLAAWLSQKHTEIMGLEDDGLRLLASGDSAGYGDKMRARARMLASLASEAQPFLAALPEDSRKQAAGVLKRFSASAQTALGLDSVFYMSALLYRDDHKPGEPDNLEVFIAGL